jgi:hypothetical protein
MQAMNAPGRGLVSGAILGRLFWGFSSSNQLLLTFHSSPVGKSYTLIFIGRRPLLLKIKTRPYACGLFFASIKLVTPF